MTSQQFFHQVSTSLMIKFKSNKYYKTVLSKHWKTTKCWYKISITFFKRYLIQDKFVYMEIILKIQLSKVRNLVLYIYSFISIAQFSSTKRFTS